MVFLKTQDLLSLWFLGKWPKAILFCNKWFQSSIAIVDRWSLIIIIISVKLYLNLWIHLPFSSFYAFWVFFFLLKYLLFTLFFLFKLLPLRLVFFAFVYGFIYFILDANSLLFLSFLSLNLSSGLDFFFVFNLSLLFLSLDCLILSCFNFNPSSLFSFLLLLLGNMRILPLLWTPQAFSLLFLCLFMFLDGEGKISPLFPCISTSIRVCV